MLDLERSIAMILSGLVKVKVIARVRVPRKLVQPIKVIKNLMNPRVDHALPPEVKKKELKPRSCI